MCIHFVFYAYTSWKSVPLNNLTLTLPKLKEISLCHQYRARIACTSVQSDEALYCWPANFKFWTWHNYSLFCSLYHISWAKVFISQVCILLKSKIASTKLILYKTCYFIMKRSEWCILNLTKRSEWCTLNEKIWMKHT